MIKYKQYVGAPGSKTIFDFELGGAHVYWVQKSGLTYQETTSVTPGNMEFKKTNVSIIFEQPFTATPSPVTSPGAVVYVGENVWVLMDV